MSGPVAHLEKEVRTAELTHPLKNHSKIEHVPGVGPHNGSIGLSAPNTLRSNHRSWPRLPRTEERLEAMTPPEAEAVG
jgi:hypothetical protein